MGVGVVAVLVLLRVGVVVLVLALLLVVVLEVLLLVVRPLLVVAVIHPNDRVVRLVHQVTRNQRGADQEGTARRHLARPHPNLSR